MGALMSDNYYTLKRVCEIYQTDNIKQRITDLETSSTIPAAERFRSGAIFQKGWKSEDLSLIGKQVGFFNEIPRPIAMAIFTTKGGVLKSTLALNLARISALHGLKTCVVGLDIQGDITTALGHETSEDDTKDMREIISKLNLIKGLPDLFNGQGRLHDLIVPTDLPELFLIPETPELVAMNDHLSNIHRREYWLAEKVITPLKEIFDVIIMDCSPNWNKLTTNALVACDVLLSPLECKINNFRNFKIFDHFLKEFKQDMGLNFKNIFIPTRFCHNKKLSMEIRDWYQKNVQGCTSSGIRESVQGEEATAMHKSVLEHAPTSTVSEDVRNLMIEVVNRLQNMQRDESDFVPARRAVNKFTNRSCINSLHSF